MHLSLYFAMNEDSWVDHEGQPGNKKNGMGTATEMEIFTEWVV